MAKGGLFGVRPVGAVTVVETPVSQSYARKARIAFMTVAAVSGVLTAAGAGVFVHPLVALVLGVVLGLAFGLVAAVLVRVWPVLRVLWWWSTEIALVAFAVLLPAWLARVTGQPWAVLVVLLVTVAVCAAVGSVRRRLAAWSWCLVVRHRLRLYLSEFVRSGNRARPGALPLVLWARPTLAGERVWLWLRPGLELADLDGKTGKLAVACWATDVRAVRASTRFAALLRVDVARRDPLTEKVTSPLAALIPLQRNGDEPAAGQVPVMGLDFDDVAEPVAQPRGGRR